VPGDCNVTIAGVLAELSELNWAPTFAFLDQQSTEVRWSTLQHLARHKRPGKPKCELWLLCASGLLPRGLRVRQDAIDGTVADRMSSMFGTGMWTAALRATRQGMMAAAEFRAELTNLMRWRLEQDLKYRTTHVFAVTNTAGTEIFDMIFATDHPVGDKIMRDVYSKAMRHQPALRRKAQLQRRQDREERSGVYGLFDLDQADPQASPATGFHVQYEHVPPHPPYQPPDSP
jgi:three-Cys-motif partner protein